MPQPLDRNTKYAFDNADLDGSTIDGCVIGGSTPAAATVTTLTASGAVTLSGALTASADATLSSSVIKLTGLTSVDPSVAGQLYKNSTGQLLVSAG